MSIHSVINQDGQNDKTFRWNSTLNWPESSPSERGRNSVDVVWWMEEQREAHHQNRVEWPILRILNLAELFLDHWLPTEALVLSATPLSVMTS